MRERIFEPFQAAESRPTQPDSIGLGLSISLQLARAMGGDLIYSYIDEQSVFTLTLSNTPPNPHRTPVKHRTRKP